MATGKRLANLDLLRIIAMFSIVVTHCIMYGAVGAVRTDMYVDMSNPTVVANWAGMYIIFFLVAIGVNCFVMLSGYLLANRTEYRWKSIFNTWLTTFFYSFGICLILLICGKAGGKDLLRCAFPIYTNQYWFMSMFLGLSLISPFLSRLVEALDRKNYIILLVVLSFMNLRLFKFPYGELFGGPHSLMWFVYLFLVGAFVKKFNPFSNFKHFGKSYFAFGILLACAYMTLSLVLWKVKGKPVAYGGTFNNSFTFVTSALLFLWAVNLKSPQGRVAGFISSVAPTMFGVYLITEHPQLRHYVWEEVIRINGMLDNPWLIPLAIVSSIAVFVVCCLIDRLRIALFKLIHFQ